MRFDKWKTLYDAYGQCKNEKADTIDILHILPGGKNYADCS